MTNRSKIILGTIIVVWIIGIVYVNTKDVKIGNNNQEQDEYNNIFDEYVYGTNNEENKIDNSIENDLVENTIETNELENNTESVVGKEEQESSKENTEIEDKNTAIDLAKQEWGISIDSYDFEAEAQGNGEYTVKVINKTTRNEITRYTVNIRTGAVVEAE